MKLPFLIRIIAICVLIASCSKDKYTTKPQLEFKSVNGEDFPSQSTLNFKFNVTDKEGDIQDTLWVQKISLLSICSSASWIGAYQVPDFTSKKNLKVEMDINYCYKCGNSSYPIIDGCEQRDDSCYFKFWLKDKAGNVSDTVTSPAIVLLKG
jgi:hypothetical protein